MWGPKNCGCKTIFGFKINLGSKKNLGPKIFWVQQNFDTKQILGPKKFWVQKNFRPQNSCKLTDDLTNQLSKLD